MRRWTNGLPGATARLGAKMALRGLSASQCRMRADTHPGPEQQCSTQRSDTLMQLSRSTAHRSPLRRTAGPYILAQSVVFGAAAILSGFWGSSVVTMRRFGMPLLTLADGPGLKPRLQRHEQLPTMAHERNSISR